MESRKRSRAENEDQSEDRKKQILTTDGNVSTHKSEGFKSFSVNTAKVLKAHCGAGRIAKANAILEKHGYISPGCVQGSNQADTTLLLDCAQNAARMGHLQDQCDIIGMLLDLGVIPNFQVMYWVGISSNLPILKRCAALCLSLPSEGPEESSLLETVIPHVLQRKMAGNFLHLVNECGVHLPVCLTSVQGFVALVQPTSCVYVDGNDGEGVSGELLESVREAVLRAWSEKGGMEIGEALEECQRLSDIATEHHALDSGKSAEALSNAIQVLQAQQSAAIVNV